jgi:alkanesulfonate monooxygenase SsuD/methylene tetrahydromethanopterin reductase-like flavin-dependent oxidoreductase (luciferase family)
VRGKIPIMIGGGGEKVMLKLVAQHADIWHGFGSPDEIRHKCEVLDAHCATVGRDPAEIERSIMLNAEEIPADAGELNEKLEQFIDAGATFFIYGTSGPEWPLDGLKALLDWRSGRTS